MTLKKTLLTLVVVFTSAATLSAQEIGDTIDVRVARGDVTVDGKLDLEDLNQMVDVLVGRARPTVSVRVMDFNADGAFDKRDVEELRRTLAQLPGGATLVDLESERAILGDANDDGLIDIGDVISLALFQFQGLLYRSPDEAADVNLDGTVNFRDFAELARAVLGTTPKLL